MVIVADTDRSVRFYHDVLGLSVEYESAVWTQLDAGAVSIGLHGAKDGPGPKPRSTVIGFYVDDLSARCTTS